MRLLIALLSLGVGTALVLFGYRLARILIPFMGFLLGISLGGAVYADASQTTFLNTALGIFVGIMSGIILAAIAYFYYYIAVTIAAASLGYFAGSGLILLLGFNPGPLSVTIGIAAGVIVGILAVISNAPKYVLITLTSLVGAVTAVGGVMLLFNKIPLEAYSYLSAKIALSNSFIWALAALVVFGTGIVAQIFTTSDYELDEWNYEHHHTAPPHAMQH